MKTLTALVCVAVVCVIASPALVTAAEVELRLTRGEAENLIQILADENVDLTATILDVASEFIPGLYKVPVKVVVKVSIVAMDWGAKQFRKYLENNLGDDGVTISLSKRGIVFQPR